MTDEELDRLAEKLADLKLSLQKTKEKPRKKGLFSKVVVTLCILIVIAYTSICLLMQWAKRDATRATAHNFLFCFCERRTYEPCRNQAWQR